MRLKKTLAMLLAVTMLFGTMGVVNFSVSAEDAAVPAVEVIFENGEIMEFDSLQSAINIGYSSPKKEIKVNRDITEAVTGLYGNIVSGNENGVTITGTSDDWVYTDDALTLGVNVTFSTEALFISNAEADIYGDIATENFYVADDATVSVYAPGSITVDGSAHYRRNANLTSGLYIYGDNDDSTVEYRSTYYSGIYSGTFYAKDANIEMGYVLLKNSNDTSYGTVKMELDNSGLTVIGTGDGQNSFHIDGSTQLSMSNSAEINNVRDFNILAGVNLNLSVDDTSKISATNVSVAEDVKLDAIQNNDGTLTFVKIFDGEGNAISPYLINNLEDLKAFRDNVNNGTSYRGQYIKLADDIDLNNVEWTPIGNATNKFEGYFDGNNKTISNLRVSGNNRYVGLFGYIEGNGMSETTTPSVKNLTLDNVSVSGDHYVGGLAGQGYTCKVENITVKGNVSGTRYVGGLIGHVYVYFDNCHFVGDASCTFDAVGGIAGAGDGRIYNSSVIGDITGNNWVGGIIANGQEGTSVVGCYVKGTVTSGQNWYFGVGGIAGVGGHGYAGSVIKDNYFDGEVYLCGEKVNAIVLGMVNAADNESIGTIVEGNSWNTEYYSAETPVVVTAEVDSADISPEEWAASASLEKSSVRNNNLVMLESDLPHVDAASSNDVVIMDFSDLSTEEVTAAVIENNRKAYVDTNKNGICDEDEIVYRDIQEAIKAAAPDGTVEILKDIKVDKWIMFSERLSIGNGNIITLVIDGLTINGNGHTLTIKSIESAGNGNRLFYDATNLNINDLTITYADGVAGGIGLESGTLSNLTINGGAQGVFPGEGEIAITDCTFKTGKAAIYNEAERNNLTVTGNTFDVGTENYAIYLRGATNFTDNTVISGKVNVVSGSPVVTDNDFGENRFKVYNGATATIEDNVINVLTFNDDSEVNSTFADNTLSDAAKEMLLSADFKVLTFETNGGEEIAPITERNYGVVIDLSTYNPQKAGYVFLCWCSDSALTQKVTSVTLNESTTVYAKYVKEPSNGSAGASGVVKYKLTFETNGGTSVKKLTAEKNTEVDLSKYVTEKEGYTFEGWYADKELTKSVTTVELTKSTTVYAKWTKIENEENPWFYDVNSTDWFYENVKYVVDNKLMNGVSEEKFAPHDTLTRAMLVTVLYRLDGEPATNRSIPFADVDMSSYYASAVIWAKQNNIVNGVTENKFAPEAEISREQIAAIMHRYAQYEGYDVRVGENTNILSYDDAESVSEYAMASMQYMVGSGLIQGKSATTLYPRDNATRAEIAAILQRFIEQNQK